METIYTYNSNNDGAVAAQYMDNTYGSDNWTY